MEFVKNKLKFKFELPVSSLQEINNLAAMAAKQFDVKPNKNTKSRKGVKVKTKVIQVPQIRTSKKVLPSSIKQMLEYLYALREKFPMAFPHNNRPALQKGVVKDIAQALKISNNTAKRFMHWYTTSGDYLQNHKEGSPRYDLNGSVVAYITGIEAEQKNKFVQNIWKIDNKS